MIRTIILLSIFIFNTSSYSLAATYKYTDKEGNIHFTDDLTNIPTEYQDQLKSETKTVKDDYVIEEKKTPTTYEKRIYQNTPQGLRYKGGCFEETKQGDPSILRPLCK